MKRRSFFERATEVLLGASVVKCERGPTVCDLVAQEKAEKAVRINLPPDTFRGGACSTTARAIFFSPMA